MIAVAEGQIGFPRCCLSHRSCRFEKHRGEGLDKLHSLLGGTNSATTISSMKYNHARARGSNNLEPIGTRIN
jgi:hypothetical protein